MSKCLSIFGIVLMLGCTSKHQWDEVECATPLVSENQNVNHIFKACRTFMYRARFWDQNFNLITDQKVRMVVTGDDWQHDPQRYSDLLVQYQFSEEEEQMASEFNLNILRQIPWKRNIHAGYLETKNDCWMHPFRYNQYLFTEIAPFPSVPLPMQPGLEWTSSLMIYDWGDWTDFQITNYYEVIGQEKVELPIGEIGETWKVVSYNETEVGRNEHTFWFNEDMGFIKMHYKNFAGQTLIFELESLTDK
ncbi:MAG: hypothetical protein JXQ90_23465 [Cyclobacteriaceae bacterium]